MFEALELVGGLQALVSPGVEVAISAKGRSRVVYGGCESRS